MKYDKCKAKQNKRFLKERDLESFEMGEAMEMLLRKGIEGLCPSPIRCFTYIFHLTVPELYPL
jgi:hypothetical protein